ncbi:adenylate/guanylate cyclase domain-containing protein [Piscinibacter sp.]|uniref:adenylate/guanylate cyclase domain-containing protein n=1 Tax=Piscinibacter sp. TaxID=1903157 RepID=UPI002BC39D07|nr:adenylate/guanylate cyclase domain-containing protein [Albitalea sp.]HUG22982.1 adenylate/guanylate cyclase domain-containing protein [Albitalea sp.]
MGTPIAEDVWHGMHRATRALAVVDVVESVRLMQANEADVIDRWRRFVNEVATQVLPPHGGRLVKSLGDGLLLEFQSVPVAVAAAIDIQRRIRPYNVDRTADAALHLRVGVHVADVVVDGLDVYGIGVNLTARLAGLGAPGDVVVSSAVRDGLVPGLDAHLEDLGQCYLKHIEAPQRAFRVVPLEGAHRNAAIPSQAELLPAVAVLPFDASGSGLDVHFGIVLADDLAAAMSRSSLWRVTSRLSTMPLAGRQLSLDQVGRVLGVHYVISGTVRGSAGAMRLSVELAEVQGRCVVWADQLAVDPVQVSMTENPVVARLIAELSRAILQRELCLAHALALPNVPGYALLLRSIALLHRVSKPDVVRAREGLEHLLERHPRVPEVRAWLAKWHVFQLAQVWSPDPPADVAQARAHLARAVDEQPEHPLALTLLGHISAFVDADQQRAEAFFRAALRSNPNEPLAWLFLSHALTCFDRHGEAVEAVERACSLSPVDPMTYFFGEFAASAYSAAGRHAEALNAASQAARLNAEHLPTLARLIVTQALAGKIDEARASARRYLAIRPNASVGRYLAQHSARHHALAAREAEALNQAGIPG